jgi:hypothetical protein
LLVDPRQFETKHDVYPNSHLTLANSLALAVLNTAKKKTRTTPKTTRRRRNIYTKLINFLGVVSFGFGLLCTVYVSDKTKKEVVFASALHTY